MSRLDGDLLRRVLADGRAVSVADLVDRLLRWGVTVPSIVRTELLTWARGQHDLGVLADLRILSVSAVVDGWTFTTTLPSRAGVVGGQDLLLLDRRFLGWDRIPVSFDGTRGMAEVMRGQVPRWVLPAGLLPTGLRGLLGMTVCPEGVRLGSVDARSISRRWGTSTVGATGWPRVGQQEQGSTASETRHLDALLQMLADDRSRRPKPLAPLHEVLAGVGDQQ